MNVFLHDMRDVGAHAADVFNQLSVYCKATKEWRDREKKMGELVKTFWVPPRTCFITLLKFFARKKLWSNCTRYINMKIKMHEFNILKPS